MVEQNAGSQDLGKQGEENAKEVRLQKRKSPITNIFMQLAMVLVACVIGLALYTEQKFSVPIALGVAILAFVAFRSVHKLLETATTSGQLGAAIPPAKSGTLSSTPAPASMPTAEPQKVVFQNASPRSPAHAPVADETPAGVGGVQKASVAVPPITPASLELLQPTGEMTSDLIARALKRELPALNDAAAPAAPLPVPQQAPHDEPENLEDGTNATESTESTEDTAGTAGTAGTVNPVCIDGTDTADTMIDQIAEELSSIRPEIGTLSIDSITRDLEAATRALEEELQATTQTQPAIAQTPEPQPQLNPTSMDEPAEPVTRLEVALDADTDTEQEQEQAPAPEVQPHAQQEIAPATEAAKDPDISDELGLQNLIKDAIRSNQAQLYLQPILGLTNRKAESFEVLTHLKNSQGELLTPSDFVDEAERAGQMPAIDDATLIRTLGVLRKLQATGAPGTMFCNLSIFSLSDDEVMGALMNALTDDPISANRLVIELSEQAYLALTPSDRDRLEDLRDLGIRLSLDHLTDAGIFMDALKNRIFSFIKVDAAFFLDKLGSGDDALMPAEILSEATLAGVDLIVEKLETSEDLERAIGLGAKYGQGYVFSEPRPVKRELLEDAA